MFSTLFSCVVSCFDSVFSGGLGLFSSSLFSFNAANMDFITRLCKHHLGLISCT